MKHLLITIAVGILGMLIAGCEPTKVAERDLNYEHYLDSIWEKDPDYYLDVIVETDKYQEYMYNFK